MITRQYKVLVIGVRRLRQDPGYFLQFLHEAITLCGVLALQSVEYFFEVPLPHWHVDAFSAHVTRQYLFDYFVSAIWNLKAEFLEKFYDLFFSDKGSPDSGKLRFCFGWQIGVGGAASVAKRWHMLSVFEANNRF